MAANRNVGSGFLFGLGLVAFIDETVFHQLLHWHHFYDKSTTAAGLVSDGFFHAFSWFATIGGLFMLAGLRRRQAWLPRRWLGGLWLGGGLFQLYDGTIQHKVPGEHGAAKVLMAPAKQGDGIIAGGPMRAVFEVMGVTDIVAKSLGSANPYNMVRATLDALKSSTTPAEVAAKRGLTVEQLFS